MVKKTVLIGGGGHARSVMDIALGLSEFEICGIIDTNKAEVLGISVIGTDEDLAAIFDSGIRHAFVALGNNSMRHQLYGKLKTIGYELVNIISEYACISGRAQLGEGICVMPGAVINVNTVIGDNCIINTNCCIDHDCKIGESCHIAPGVSMSGTVRVGDGTHIGTGAAVIDGVSIGKWSYIGAGAAVVKDIPDYVMAYGVPAKMVRTIKGERL
ncbi:MAG: acetyltransferase [Christensenellaceae bacterium]|jgi:UDP-perosamine 4-acetyltransferase